MVERYIMYFLIFTWAAGLTTFVVSYFLRSNWRDNIVGRYMLYFFATLTGLVIYMFVYPLLRNIPGILYINILVLLLMNYGAWRMTFLLLKIQWKEREHEDSR